MILSMTGFGKAVKVINNKKITAEVKSLNSKQLDLSVRVPQGYRALELDLRNMVAHKLNRGKVDLYVFCEPIEGAASVSINLSVLKQYKAQLQDMATELGISEPEDWYATLLRLPDALKSDVNVSEVSDEEMEAVKEVVAEALDGLVAFRVTLNILQRKNRSHSRFAQQRRTLRALACGENQGAHLRVASETRRRDCGQQPL